MPETYTGDEGDDALDAGYDVMDGNEDRRDGWRAINKTRDYIAAVKNSLSTMNWPWSRISGKPTTFPPSSHTHSRLQSGSNILAFRPSPYNEWNTANNMYVGGYLNVQGTIYNPSARDMKRDITAPPELAGIFPELVEYEYKKGDGRRVLGYLANELIGTGAERFVKLDPEGNPEAIDYLGLLVAQVAQLNARVAELEAKP